MKNTFTPVILLAKTFFISTNTFAQLGSGIIDDATDGHIQKEIADTTAGVALIISTNAIMLGLC